MQQHIGHPLGHHFGSLMTGVCSNSLWECRVNKVNKDALAVAMMDIGFAYPGKTTGFSQVKPVGGFITSTAEFIPVYKCLHQKGVGAVECGPILHQQFQGASQQVGSKVFNPRTHDKMRKRLLSTT